MKNKALKEILFPITIIKYHQVLASTFQMLFTAENLQGQSTKKVVFLIFIYLFYFYNKNTS